MRLEKVEIVGFKSFCDKQELSFQGGVTGIVGPNGCGKSNISDAISWVLGEQSAKSLRGASMEDVIFAGSQARQPLGMAEVNLKRLRASTATAPTATPSASVTRRLYRNGESEYLMNGAGVPPARTSTSCSWTPASARKAYSIIEQGKIGLILSSKPADRRAPHRGGRRHHQVQGAPPADAAQAGGRAAEPAARERHRPRGREAAREPEAPGRARRAAIARCARRCRASSACCSAAASSTCAAQAALARARGSATKASASRRASIALETEEAQMEARRTVLYEEEGAARRTCARALERADRSPSTATRAAAATARSRSRRRKRARRPGADAKAAELEARVAPLGAANSTARRTEEQTLRDERGCDQRHAPRAPRPRCMSARPAGAQLEARAGHRARRAGGSRSGGSARCRTRGASVSGNAERAAADLLKLAAEIEELRARAVRARVALRADARRPQAVSDASIAGLRERATAPRSRARGAAPCRGGGRVARLTRCRASATASPAAWRRSRRWWRRHSAFDEGVRALLAEPGGSRSAAAWWPTPWRPSPRTSARWRPSSATACRPCWSRTPRRALRGIALAARSRAPGAARSCRSRPRARSTMLRRACATLQREEPRARGLLERPATASTGPTPTPSAPRCPRRWWSTRSRTRSSSRHAAARCRCVTLAGETLRGAVVEGGRARARACWRRAARSARLDEHARASSRRPAERGARARDGARSAMPRPPTARARAARGADPRRREGPGRAPPRPGDRRGRARPHRPQGVGARHRAQPGRAGARRRRGAAGRDRQAALATAERRSRRGRRAARRAWPARGRGARRRGGGAGARRRGAQPRWPPCASAPAAAEAECAAARSRAPRAARAHRGRRQRAAEMDERGAAARRRAAQHRERLLAEALARPRRAATARSRCAEDRGARPPQRAGGREAGAQGAAPRARDAARRPRRAEVAQARNELGPRPPRRASATRRSARRPPRRRRHSPTRTVRSSCASARDAGRRRCASRIERMGPVNVLAVEQSQELEERHTFLTAQRQDLLDSIAELDQRHQEDRQAPRASASRRRSRSSTSTSARSSSSCSAAAPRASACSTRTTSSRAAST